MVCPLMSCFPCLSVRKKMKPKQTKGGCIDLVEKMKLIHVQGTLPHLDEFLGRCCLDGRVNLEPASQYMSASLGYGPLNEEDPYTPLVARIETLAQQLEAQLPATPARPLGASGDDAALLDQLGHKLADLRGQRDSLVINSACARRASPSTATS